MHELADGRHYLLLCFGRYNKPEKKLPEFPEKLKSRDLLQTVRIPYNKQNRKVYRKMGIKRECCVLVRPDLYIETLV